MQLDGPRRLLLPFASVLYGGEVARWCIWSFIIAANYVAEKFVKLWHFMKIFIHSDFLFQMAHLRGEV